MVLTRSLACAVLLALLTPTSWAQGGSTKRASLSASGGQGDLGSFYDSVIALSGDGLKAAFATNATNLDPADTNGARDVFVHDLVTGELELISVSTSGTQGNSHSWHPSISTSGRYVAFLSQATNLVPGDTNGSLDVFVRDRLAGTTVRVSVSSAGTQASSLSSHPSISADGQTISFRSFADNLDPLDTNGWDDIYVHELQSGITRLVSVGESGEKGSTNCGSSALSKDGRFVVFHHGGTNLVPGNVDSHVYVKDLVTGSLELADVDPAGNPSSNSPGADSFPGISDDGRFVSFRSSASDLVAGDVNGFPDIFLRDRLAGTTELVSVSSTGELANLDSRSSSISETGRYIAFGSWASNLVPGDTNGEGDIFVRDRVLGTTELVSVAMDGGLGNDYALTPTISPGGRFVAFNSLSSNLVPGDTNGFTDTFVRDRNDCSPTVASHCTASSTSLPGCSASLSGAGTPSLSSPGAFSIATGAMPGANLGIAYFGTSGPSAAPFGSQGGALCVAPPVLRSQAKASGGTQGSCNGQLTFTLADLASSGPALIQAGSLVHVAVWFRDPPSPDGFGLSNGLWFTVCP